jgi:photosystem II stability/assembly factor-like uncharacterized protein
VKTQPRLTTIHFADATTGWTAGVDGLILRTDDAGKQWKQQESKVKLNLFAVSVASPLDALIVGEQGRVMQTKDGGVTWDALASATSVPLFAVAYRGGSAAWVAGRGGAILRRTNSVATVNIPRPKLPPALRGKKPTPETDELPPALNERDIPRALPPNKKRPPAS